MKKPAFPNQYFNSQEELFDFMDKVKIYTMPELYAKKKEEDKQIIPYPIIRNPRSSRQLKST